MERINERSALDNPWQAFFEVVLRLVEMKKIEAIILPSCIRFKKYTQSEFKTARLWYLKQIKRVLRQIFGKSPTAYHDSNAVPIKDHTYFHRRSNAGRA